MTQEEKAKAYDEIIKKANKMHNENCEACQICIEELISELKESEDERIRKEIISFLENIGVEEIKKIPRDICEWFAWLEKQGESKPAESIKEYNFHGVKFIPKFAKGNIIKNKKHGEITTIEDFFYDTGLYTHTYGQFPITIQDNYERIEKPTDKVEPKFREEDEERIKNILSVLSVQVCWDGATGEKMNPYQREIDWLKSIKDRVLPKPKQEWSEDDEKMIRGLIAICDVWTTSHSFYATGNCDMEKLKNWLKSLKDRVQPKLQNKWKESLTTADLENSLCDIQDGFSDTSYEYRILGEAIEFIRCTESKPQWKPSDEQMITLRHVISGCSYDIEPLVEIEEHLKKLKG